MSKFKAGDKVRVIGNTNYHEYEIGTVVTLWYFYDEPLYPPYWDTGDWFVRECDMELVEDTKMEHKFKVGDKVRVVNNICGHGFDSGDVVTVVGFFYDGYDCHVEGSRDTWFLVDGELELVTTQDTPKPFDPVSKPSHYNQYGIEAIDSIRASLGPVGFQAYCKGNVIKYLWRYEYKNGIEDLKKAQVYLNWMVESKEATE